MSQNIYKVGLSQNQANYTPLSPLTFFARAAQVHPDHLAVVHGERRYNWAETYTRCRQLASALTQSGIGEGDTVSILGFNTPEMFEAHFGVPMTGAVLHSINTRLDAKTIAFMLEHAETDLLITDRAASATIQATLGMFDRDLAVIDIDDVLAVGGTLLGEMDYEAFLATGDPQYDWHLPDDEWDAISLNYTSGTTGQPQGCCLSSPRGLSQCSQQCAGLGYGQASRLSVDVAHVSLQWLVLSVDVGRSRWHQSLLRAVDVDDIYRLIAEEGVTHYCGAPIVHSMIANAPAELKAKKEHLVKGMVAGAPPPAAVLDTMAKNGFEITHVYGLTETYGPATVCDWKREWNELTADEQADLKARQGVRYPMLESLAVMDPDTLQPTPADGVTMGEVCFRGNIVMKGYLKNPTATEEAFKGGWFHSGDLGVLHPDGYIELKDRTKDIIISGGENISTIEVEGVLFHHPAVMDAAVVARPDEKWGETPCAFVTLKEDAPAITEQEIIDFCRAELARYKCPKTVVFGPLPKTSTGKTQKFVLREQAKNMSVR